MGFLEGLILCLANGNSGFREVPPEFLEIIANLLSLQCWIHGQKTFKNLPSGEFSASNPRRSCLNRLRVTEIRDRMLTGDGSVIFILEKYILALIKSWGRVKVNFAITKNPKVTFFKLPGKCMFYKTTIQLARCRFHTNLFHPLSEQTEANVFSQSSKKCHYY